MKAFSEISAPKWRTYFFRQLQRTICDRFNRKQVSMPLVLAGSRASYGHCGAESSGVMNGFERKLGKRRFWNRPFIRL